MARNDWTVGAVAGALPGAVVGAVFGAAAKIRRTKPLHPQGRVGRGVLVVTDPHPELGVPLLAEPGRHDCVSRWSRSAGLPPTLPDIEGLAVRVEEEDADILFSATGTGPLTRFVLAFRRPARHGPQSTILPVATAAGPVLFLATPAEPELDEPPSWFDLSLALGRGEWRKFGHLEIPVWGPDEPTRFDPVANLLPGTEQYPVVRVVREPAYLLARRAAPLRNW